LIPWEYLKEAEARERELDAEVRAAERAFERLNRETPDEARDEQGWTPELLAAARRHSRALIERGEHGMREIERLKTIIADEA
jgi:hypothetical protein